MREIKFRAWDEHKRKMIANPVVSDEGDGGETASVLLNTAINCLDPYYVLMQYTGLKDKNGKEIYEGDIVSDTEIMDEVTFVDGMFWLNYSEEPLYHYISVWEVIGNIHENPELLI